MVQVHGDRAKFDSAAATEMTRVVQQLSIDADMWPQWPADE